MATLLCRIRKTSTRNTFAMLYKPNFCCNCGERVQRIEWNLLTSRRFCEVCSAENKKYDLLPRITVGVGLLAAVFGFGSFYGNSGPSRDEPRQLNLSQATRSSVPQRTIQPEDQPENVAPSAPVMQAPVDAGIDRVLPDQNQFASKNGSKAAAVVYFCGARTKKGTPCSRRVKHPSTRCYQHEGKAAAMPEN